MSAKPTSAPPYPLLPERLPEDFVEGGYRVAYARDEGDLQRVLELRFRVFNLEMGEGLAESYRTGRDEDGFDRGCHHLMVLPRDSDEVVGTYRLQGLAQAEAHRGFYSAGEFELAGLPRPILEGAVEVGRTCVAPEARMGQVFFLLWRGLARYLEHNRHRYLFGCCSLPTQDPAVAWRAEARLRKNGHLHPELRVEPTPACRCPSAPGGVEPGEDLVLPQLFRMYLRYGGKICGPPAIDRAFGTIDFFVLLDVEAVDPATREPFFRRSAPR